VTNLGIAGGLSLSVRRSGSEVGPRRRSTSKASIGGVFHH
jgi:hypothetical protein